MNLLDLFKRGPKTRTISPLDKAEAAIAMGDFPALVSAADEIIQSASANDRTSQYLASVLIMIGDHLAKNPEYLPKAISIFESAAGLAHPGSETKRQVYARIIKHAPDLPEVYSRCHALWSVALPRHSGAGSEEEKEAVAAFIQSVEGISDISKRFMEYEDSLYYDRFYHAVMPYNPIPSDCLLARSIGVKLEELDQVLSDKTPARMAARRFVELHRLRTPGQ